ncbi:MAG: hypothetical protein AAF720_02140 [Pseudomonadota bacterium]
MSNNFLRAFALRRKDVSLFDGSSQEATFSWPKKAVISALKERYGTIEELSEETGYSVLGIVENDIRFAVILVKRQVLNKKSDEIIEVGFVARFEGFSMSEADISAVNGNLHISVMAQDAGGDLFLVGGVLATNEFNNGAFQLVLEAWRRDLAIAIQGVTQDSFFGSHPALLNDVALNFAINRRQRGDNVAPEEMLSRFLGGHRSAVMSADDSANEKKGLFRRLFNK